LRAALAVRHGCSPENIVVGAGIDDLLGLAVRAYVGTGAVAVATAGTYPTFAYHVSGYGGHLATVPYNADFSVNGAALLRAARERNAALIYLANPDNPGGTFMESGAVAALLEKLPAGALLIVDEAYSGFVDPALLPPDWIDPRVVRMRTFSKAYGMAGMRIAYAVGDASLCATFGKIRLQYGVCRTAQAGALAALGDEPFAREVARRTAEGRAAYAALGARLGLPVHPSQANFVLFDAGTRGRAEALLGELERRAVFVRKPGVAPLDRCIRVTVGTPAEQRAFAAALEPALAAIGPA
jgi:histidinol-phosphate aminotransferase